ncbi:MAG TPA: dephospho-CoA kinase, partial [Chloroflexota bacterium]|nr:dephospho-CoA kinase [Chloroflexota bacterium]
MSLYVLGITGPIGCGKSTVAAMVSDLGARAVLDADAVTHRLMASGQDLTAAISVEFGTGVLGGDG